jgi:DNA-binding winged helix-turn-helix (wHTH) protein
MPQDWITTGYSELGSTSGDVFCFGRFRLVARERVLMKDDAPVHLGSRAFDLLLTLVQRAGETINRAELLDLVWPDVVVVKCNLRVQVAGLRKVLDDGQDGRRFIISVAGRGYRFVAGVSRVQAVSLPALTEPSAAPLPVWRERMFGRDAAIETLSAQLSRKRFTSLEGPGGRRRTSIAFALARTLATDFDDAVCLVDLAGIDHPTQLATTVATALGCEVHAHRPLESLLAYLQDKEMLLVFDNCEGVSAPVAQLTERLFTEAPLVHVLVSSRGALLLSPATHQAT